MEAASTCWLIAVSYCCITYSLKPSDSEMSVDLALNFADGWLGGSTGLSWLGITLPFLRFVLVRQLC